VSDQRAAGLDDRPGGPGDEAVFEAPALLRLLWADPQNMPEHLALWSLKRFGPRASSAVEKLRTANPDAGPAALERAVIERQTRISMAEGAFSGGPLLVLIPVAFCAALLAQAQMAFELATLAGYASDDEMRAADLLVLQGAYASTEDASAALEKVARDPKGREGKRLPRGTRWSMIKRMAYLLGVMGASDTKRSRMRAALGWIGVGLVLLVGLVLPFVWVPYMALAFRKSGHLMGKRATSFYAEGHGAEAAVVVRSADTVHLGISTGLARLVALYVLPIAVAVIALLTGTDLGAGRWFSAWILLIAVWGLVTLAWFAYRWWRFQRRAAD
jgi:hypothetical protein